MSDTARGAFIERMLNPHRKVGDAELKIWADDYEVLQQRVEGFRVLLDEFQQEAQTRLKDYAPEMINTRIIALKAALVSQEEA